MGRYKLLSTLTPNMAAETVVNWYVEKAATDVGEWSSHYVDKINNYVNNSEKQREAAKKLTIWYSELLKQRAAISEAVNRARQSYMTAKQRLLAQAPTMR